MASLGSERRWKQVRTDGGAARHFAALEIKFVQPGGVLRFDIGRREHPCIKVMAGLVNSDILGAFVAGQGYASHPRRSLESGFSFVGVMDRDREGSIAGGD